jgi:hypothetical protein
MSVVHRARLDPRRERSIVEKAAAMLAGDR